MRMLQERRVRQLPEERARNCESASRRHLCRADGRELLTVKLLFCVEAEHGFETGSTRCEISVGCCRQRHSVGAVIAVRPRCEAFAQRQPRKD